MSSASLSDSSDCQRLQPLDVKLALLRGIPSASLDQCINTHELLDWDSRKGVTVQVVLKNEAVVAALLELCPERVPAVRELTPGFIEVDRTYSMALSGAKSKTSATHWAQCEGEKLRAMLAHIREITRKSQSPRSKQPAIQRLKEMVVHQRHKVADAGKVVKKPLSKKLKRRMKRLLCRKRKPPATVCSPPVTTQEMPEDSQPWWAAAEAEATQPDQGPPETDTETHISVSETDDEAEAQPEAPPVAEQLPEAPPVAAQLPEAQLPEAPPVLPPVQEPEPPVPTPAQPPPEPPAFVAPPAPKPSEQPQVEGKPMAGLRIRLQPPASWQWAAQIAKQNQDVSMEAQLQHKLRVDKRQLAAKTRQKKPTVQPEVVPQPQLSSALPAPQPQLPSALPTVVPQPSVPLASDTQPVLQALPDHKAREPPQKRSRHQQGAGSAPDAASSVATEVASTDACKGAGAGLVIPSQMLRYSEVIAKLPPGARPPATASGASNYTLRNERSSCSICVRPSGLLTHIGVFASTNLLCLKPSPKSPG